jgi:t-SNARE complex subunit (syntaxin)
MQEPRQPQTNGIIDMSELEDIKQLLVEIRDNQQRSIVKQDEHIALAQQHLERAKTQVEESIGLQREAIAKQRSITRIAVPGILACILAIVYLVVRYF